MTGKTDGSVSHANLLELQLRRLQGIYHFYKFKIFITLINRIRLIQCGLDAIFQVKEIYNYTQDDLITEDVLLLDCQREIYIWVGLHSVVKSKQEALNLGLVSCLLAFHLCRSSSASIIQYSLIVR